MHTKEKETLKAYNLKPVLSEMAKRTDLTGKVARCAKALSDIEHHKHSSPETYAEMRQLILKNLFN